MARVDLTYHYVMTEWRGVGGFEGLYEVSDDGQVKSLSRIRPDGRRQPEKILRQASFQDGRQKVTLTKNGVQTTHRVHSLVAAAFIGPRPEGLGVLHRNGIPSDNRVENLYYGTQGDNMRDAVRHGTHAMSLRTQCPDGHPYDEENTLVYGGKRNCRKCRNARQRERRALQKQGA